MIIAPRYSSPIASQGLSTRSVAANITSADGRVGWVSASPGRSTSNILWSCFSILLICAWKSIHFNVPSDEERDAGWHKLWKTLPYWPTKSLWRRWCKRLGFMVMVILAPEIGVAIAMDQYLSARMVEEEINMRNENSNGAEILKKANERRGDSEGKGVEKLPTVDAEEINTNDQELSTMLRIIRKESVFGPPYGYLLSEESKLTPRQGGKSLPRKRNEITKKHAFLANMGGLQTRISFFPQDGKDEALPEPIEIILQDWRSLDILLFKFPDIQLLGDDEIDDLSKADVFTKVFACVQSVWLVVQSISRVSAGLPITQLELATIALVFCALLMYTLWWDKPFGVERRVTIHANYSHSISATVEAIKQLTSKDLAVITWMKDGPAIAKSTKEYLTLYFRRLLMSSVDIGFFGDDIPTKNELGHLTIGILFVEKDDILFFGKTIRDALKNLFGVSCTITIPRDFTIFLTFYLTATMFSAFHIGAWNWEFPTPTIRIVWRSLALAATCAAPIAIVIFAICAGIPRMSDGPLRRMSAYITTVTLSALCIVYVVARLGLIALIFYCFCSMPAGVYETVKWTDFLPHVS